MSRSASSARLIALIVACAMFMAQLDGAIVAIALPAMARSFGVAPLQLTASITVYLLAQVIFLPSSAWIAERYGARRVFAAAILVFTLASMLCALSHSLGQLVAARILQGCAAALMTPVGRVVLLHSTDRKDLIRVMTISTVPMLVAPTVGPALGGFITTYWSWQWIFLLNAPFGIAGAIMVVRLIPQIPADRTRAFDPLGFVLFASASTMTLYALQWLADDVTLWTRPAILLAGGIATGLLAARHARRHRHPIISLAALDIPTFSIAAVRGGALIRPPVRALTYLLPMMLQLTLGYDAFRAGILMLALNGGDLLLKTLTTLTLRRFGFRSILLVSTALSAMTIVICAGFSATTSFAVIFALLLVSGMFRSLLFTGLSTLVFADVPRAETAGASTLWNIVQQGTNVLGVSLSAIALALSALQASEPRNQPTLHDFHVALLLMAAIAALSLLSLRRLPADAGAAISGHRSQ